MAFPSIENNISKVVDSKNITGEFASIKPGE